MIRKVFVIIVVVSAVRLLISCCTEEITFDTVEFKAVKYDSYWREVDTFDTKIIFEIYLIQNRFVFLKMFDQHNLYATSCGHDYKNSMDTSTIDLRTDKSIVIGLDTIKQNENLWTNPLIKKYIDFTEDDINPTFTWLIQINNEGLSKMKFEDNLYNFYFTVKMTDSSILKDSTNVLIKI